MTSQSATQPGAAQRPDKLAAVLLFATLVLLAWSGYKPYGYVIWALEVSPAVAAIAILAGLHLVVFACLMLATFFSGSP